MRERQFKERKDLLALELQTKELELEALDDRHAVKMRAVEEAFQQEEQTYLADQERAEQLLAELQEAKQAEEQALDDEHQADEDYQEEERLERERNPWDDDPIRRSK